MSRPLSPNKKRVTLKFRVTVSDANDIFYAATQEGKTYSQFIRDVLRDYIEARYGDYFDVPEEQLVLPGMEGFWRSDNGSLIRMSDKELNDYLKEHPEHLKTS